MRRHLFIQLPQSLSCTRHVLGLMNQRHKLPPSWGLHPSEETTGNEENLPYVRCQVGHARRSPCSKRLGERTSQYFMAVATGRSGSFASTAPSSLLPRLSGFPRQVEKLRQPGTLRDLIQNATPGLAGCRNCQWASEITPNLGPCRPPLK